MQTTTLAKRAKPQNYISFEPPLVGPSGAQLVGYVWKYKWEEYITRTGDDAARRISDWGEAEDSSETRRAIVHQFHVYDANGNLGLVSRESVLKLLGFIAPDEMQRFQSVSNAVKALARVKIQLASLEAKLSRNKQINDEVIALPLPPMQVPEPIPGGRVILTLADERVWWGHSRQATFETDYGYKVRLEKERTERVDCLVRAWRSEEARKRGYVVVTDERFNLNARMRRIELKIAQMLAHAGQAGIS